MHSALVQCNSRRLRTQLSTGAVARPRSYLCTRVPLYPCTLLIFYPCTFLPCTLDLGSSDTRIKGTRIKCTRIKGTRYKGTRLPLYLVLLYRCTFVPLVLLMKISLEVLMKSWIEHHAKCSSAADA